MNTLTLEQLRRNFAGMASLGRTAVRQFNREAALVAHAGVMDGFRRQTDPDGVPWRRLARGERVRGGSVVLQDRGRLRQSCKATATDTQIVLTASHPGANVHQYGATIRPVKAKRLAIPLTKEAARRPSPRDFGRPLFYLVSRKQTEFLAENRTKGRGRNKTRQLVLQYALKTSVVIPRRTYLGFSEDTLRKIDRLYADRVEEFVTSPFAYLDRTKSSSVAAKWGK